MATVRSTRRRLRGRLRAVFGSGGADLAFDAFISYSHAADGRLAPALQRAVQRLAKPWYRPRALHVFRDEAALSANPHLWSSIQTALDESEWFVLLASPDAVASQWVARELDYWLTTKSADRILAVVTGGDWEWDAITHALTGTAVPDALRDAFPEEPRHVDLRWAATETDLDMHHARFRDVVAQLAAPMHGIAKDDLDSEDVRQHRRTQRLARGGVTILTLLVIISLVATAFAVVQRNSARIQRDRADVQATRNLAASVASQASVRADSNIDLSLLLAAQAYRLDDSTVTRGALVAALTGAQSLAHVEYLPGLSRAIAASASANGERVILSRGSNVELWTTNPPRRRWTVDVGGPITSLALSPDARVLATRTKAGLLELRDATDGRTRARVATNLTGPLPYAPLAFSPDSRHLAVMGVGIYDIRNEYALSRPRTFAFGSVHQASALVFSADGKRVAFSTVDDQLDIIPIGPNATGGTIRALPGIGEPGFEIVSALATGPSPDLFAFGTTGGNVGVYSVSSRRALWEIPGRHTAAIKTLNFNADGRLLASSGQDGRVVLWKATTGERYGLALGGVGGAMTAAFFTGDRLGSVPTASAARDPRLARAAADTLVTVSPTALAQWRLDTFNLGVRTAVPDAQPCGLVASQLEAAGPSLASFGNCAWLWDVQHQRLGSPLPPLPTNFELGAVNASFDGSGHRLAVASTYATDQPQGGRGRVTIFDSSTRRILRTIELGGQVPERVALSPDGLRLAVTSYPQLGTSDDTQLTTFDVATGRSNRTLRLPSTYVYALRYSPDGHTLAAGTLDGRVRFWDPPTGRELSSKAEASIREIDDVAFSPDGSLLAAASGDGTVRVWDVHSRRQHPGWLQGRVGPLARLAFAADSRVIAVVSWSHTLLRWDVRTSEQLGPSLPLQPEPLSIGQDIAGGSQPDVAFVRNTLVTASIDTSVTFWDLQPQHLAARACTLARRNLTRAEWNQYLSGRPYRPTCSQWPAGT